MSKNYLVVFTINIAIWFFLMIANLISIFFENEYVKLNINQNFFDYFSILTTVLFLLFSCSLLVLVIYIVIAQRRVIKQFNQLVDAFKTADQGIISTEAENYSADSLAIINSWNQQIKLRMKDTEKRDLFFKQMSHKFNGSVHIIKANIQMYLVCNQSQNRQIQTIGDEVSDLESELNKFLLVEKIKYFETPRRTYINLEDFFNAFVEIYDLVHFQIEIDYLELKAEYKVDEAMLSKVVENIIDNAYKHGLSNILYMRVSGSIIKFTNEVCEDVNLGNVFADTKQKCSKRETTFGVSIINSYVEINNWKIESKQHGKIFEVILNIT